jgi:20S proteasome alpha/beta subunit
MATVCPATPLSPCLACSRLLPCALAGGSFVLSLMDKAWRPGMSVDEALALADAAIAEVRSRLVVAPPNYVIKIVDKDGARVLAERISAEVVNSS